MSHQNQATHGNAMEQENAKRNAQYYSPQAPQPAGAYAQGGQQPGVAAGKNGKWHYSLCVCCQDMNSCCGSWCCTPCQQSRQCNMITESKSEIHWPYCLLLTFVDPICTGGLLSCIFACQTRRLARDRYGIKGSDCGDCCTGWCCRVCNTQQVLLEMTTMNDFPGATCYDAPQKPSETRIS